MNRSMNLSMWRRLVALICCAAILVTGCSTAPTAPRAVTLAGVVVEGQRLAGPEETGLVRIERYGRALEGVAGTVLESGDMVMTGPSAYALIRYPSGSEVFMRPNTRGRVGSFIDMVGEVFTRIRGAFAIQTTFVKAGAEGTAYTVRSAPNGQYAVVVVEGNVQLSSLTGAWAPVMLARGSMAAGQPQVPPRPMPAPPDELARTRAWVERIETLVPAPRSSGAGAGAALAIAGLAAILMANQGGGGDQQLAAPTGLSPAGPSLQEAAIPHGCYPLVMTWQPVRGAHDYVVTLEALAMRTAVAPVTLASTTPTVSAPRLSSGPYRWRVHARDGSGKAGPDSAMGYFRCPG